MGVHLYSCVAFLLLHLLKLVICEGLNGWSLALCWCTCEDVYALAKSSLVVLGYSKVKSLYGGGRRGRV